MMSCVIVKQNEPSYYKKNNIILNYQQITKTTTWTHQIEQISVHSNRLKNGNSNSSYLYIGVRVPPLYQMTRVIKSEGMGRERSQGSLATPSNTASASMTVTVTEEFTLLSLQKILTRVKLLCDCNFSI